MWANQSKKAKEQNKSLEERLKTAIGQFEAEDARGSARGADKYENEIKELKRKIIKEKKENKQPLHPS